MSELLPPDQNDMYVRALRSLDKAGKVSDHHKPAETREEIELMHQTSKAVSTSSFMTHYKAGQYELIFANPLARTAYLIDHETALVDRIQVWSTPEQLLETLQKGGREYEDTCIA